MIHVRRREKAKKKLISYVSAERERLHRNILKNTTERQDKTDQGTTVMTITKIKYKISLYAHFNLFFQALTHNFFF